MITHFIEATNNNQNWGKFMLARFDTDEALTKSALPGYEAHNLFVGRGFTPDMTFVVDLQTGEGAAFTLYKGTARADLQKHKIWVCPMFEPFLEWLYQQMEGSFEGDITKLPRFVNLPDAPFDYAGYRRAGVGGSE